MMYLIVDGMASGTGIRDAVNGGFLKLNTLETSSDFNEKLLSWLRAYENEHYNSYSDDAIVNALDKRGIELARELSDELKDAKVEYYSSAKLTKYLITPLE
jgi:hypothetical protein